MEAAISIRNGQTFPEDADYVGADISFDPTDPVSIKQASALLQARLGLSRAPVLCGDPPQSLLNRVRRFVSELLAITG